MYDAEAGCYNQASEPTKSFRGRHENVSLKAKIAAEEANKELRCASCLTLA